MYFSHHQIPVDTPPTLRSMRISKCYWISEVFRCCAKASCHAKSVSTTPISETFPNRQIITVYTIKNHEKTEKRNRRVPIVLPAAGDFLHFRKILHREITFFFYTKRLKPQNCLAPTGYARSPPTQILMWKKLFHINFFSFFPHQLIFLMWTILADLLHVENSHEHVEKKRYGWFPHRWAIL